MPSAFEEEPPAERPRVPARLRPDPPANLIELAVGRALGDPAAISRGRWLELGLRTNTNPRLLRSLGWDDPDYPEWALEFAPLVMGKQTKKEWPSEEPTVSYQHLHDVLRFLGLEAWLAKHDPDLHGRLYEVDDLAVFDPGADDPAEGWRDSTAELPG